MVDHSKFAEALASMEARKSSLHEEVHHEIQGILDSNDDPDHKFRLVHRKMRDFAKHQVDSGFEYGMMKGSSRAVYYPKDAKHINLDGKPTKVPYVTKIAFEGELDPYKKDPNSPLLGQMQNEMESDPFIQRSHSVMVHESGDNYRTNPNGVIPPHFGGHPDNHYLHAGRVELYNSKDFKEATKTRDFPNGISHPEFKNALHAFWEEAHGRKSVHTGRQRENLDRLMEHPVVGNFANFIADTDAHPIDMVPGNMGIWTHPHTGKKHVVLLDHGYSNDIMKEYIAAKMNHSDPNFVPR